MHNTVHNLVYSCFTVIQPPLTFHSTNDTYLVLYPTFHVHTVHKCHAVIAYESSQLYATMIFLSFLNLLLIIMAN